MSMLNKTPIDYVIWGNHEHDMAHEDVMKREKEYQGVWINSNMTSHESFKDSKCQVDSAVLEICSPDGSNVRKLGMIGVLSSTPELYKPGAFGGATIETLGSVLKDLIKSLKLKAVTWSCPFVICMSFKMRELATISIFQ